jgi:hypothetical protein
MMDQFEFDEAWYLDKNPDVARAVADGVCKSGREHYVAHGHRVGRLPVPPDGWVKKNP